MLLIKTTLAPSKIHGIGLFADQDIKKGDITWRYEPRFDTAFTTEELAKMPQLIQEFVTTYAAFSPYTHRYISCNDDARFTNHSSSPNVIAEKRDGEEETIGVAARDIHEGEEITMDYRSIDEHDAAHPKPYMK
jgi:SET domain-containing protein